MITAKSTKAYLFIEGMEVPFVDITVTSTVGQPASAQITIVPLREGKNFAPRSLISVFVLDDTYVGVTKPWVLLFSGEFYGYQFARTTESRAITLLAISESNYWDSAKQYYLNMSVGIGESYSVDKARAADAALKSDSAGLTLSPLALSSYIANLISAELAAGKDLIQAVIKVVKSIGETNAFYRYGAARHRLFDRVFFKSSGDLKKMFNLNNNEAFFDALTGGGNSAFVSIRDVVSLVMNLVFHMSSEPLAPSFIEGKIASFIYFPDSYMLPPPRCNMIFADHYTSFGFTRNYLTEPSRSIFQPLPPRVVIQNTTNSVVKGVVETYYSPTDKGFSKYMGPEKTSYAGDDPLDGKAGQGYTGESTEGKGVVNTTQQRTFNFLNHEEVLKGIVSSQGGSPPLANMFGNAMNSADRVSYFQKVGDYLFYESRYAPRTSATAGPLNIAPVPGFNILFLDSSETGHHVVGKLNSITHAISSTAGATTTYQISHSREVGERDVWLNNAAEPPIPPWYASAIFGTPRAVRASDYEGLSKENQEQFIGLKTLNDFSNVSAFYQALLGKTNPEAHRGSEALTTSRDSTVLGATLRLSEQYEEYAKMENTQGFIALQVRRPYTLLTEYFTFLGVVLKSDQKNLSFAPSLDGVVFTGPVFDGGYVDNANANKQDQVLKNEFGAKSVARRRSAVRAYLNVLRSGSGGFRG